MWCADCVATDGMVGHQCLPVCALLYGFPGGALVLHPSAAGGESNLQWGEVEVIWGWRKVHFFFFPSKGLQWYQQVSSTLNNILCTVQSLKRNSFFSIVGSWMLSLVSNLNAFKGSTGSLLCSFHLWKCCLVLIKPDLANNTSIFVDWSANTQKH